MSVCICDPHAPPCTIENMFGIDGVTLVATLAFGLVRNNARRAVLLTRALRATRGRHARTTTTIALPVGAVRRLDRASGTTSVYVRQGTVWITTTPANGDVIVRAGERYVVTHRGPVVIQALSASEVVITAHQRSVRVSLS